MSSLADYLEERILNQVHNAVVFGTPQNWLALFTAAPSDAGGGTEVAGGSYARQRIFETGSASAPKWTAAAPAGTAFGVQNASDVTWPAASADWGEIVALGIFDDVTGGNLLAWHWLSDAFAAFTGKASDDIITAPGVVLVNADRVILKGEALPGGLGADVIYHVRDVSGTTCKLAATGGGAAIDLTADGGGEIYKLAPVTILSGATFRIVAGSLRSRLA